MTVAWLIIGHGRLEAIERAEPEFHAVEILVQLSDRLHKSSEYHISCRFRFRHRHDPANAFLVYLQLKGWLALWFPDRQA